MGIEGCQGGRGVLRAGKWCSGVLKLHRAKMTRGTLRRGDELRERGGAPEKGRSALRGQLGGAC